jgi:parallel beta-helix repeat protein
MEKRKDAGLTSKHPWPAGRALALAAALAAVLGCSSNSATSSAPPSLTIAPAVWTVIAGGPAKQFTAKLTQASDPISWSIETPGAAGEVGTLSGGVYTPPASITAARDVVVKVTAGALVARATVHILFEFRGSPSSAVADCAPELGTPVIGRVNAPATAGGGPLIPAIDPDALPTIEIFSDGVHGFGTQFGAVLLTDPLTGVEHTLPNTGVIWTDDLIQIRVPAGSTTGQLEVQHENGKRTVAGVTLTIENVVPRRVPSASYPTIQAAIDAAADGDLILVEPGTYREQIVIDKSVRLQGWGARSTVIDATGTTQGPAILVSGNTGTRIDGFTVTGASGGGIVVSGNVSDLRISNNDIVANSASCGGGIRIGNPDLVDAANDRVDVANNYVVSNAATGGGGGIAVCTGSDAYLVRGNYVCGNVSNGSGGGIAHLGVSRGGKIARNVVRFNRAYQGSQASNGGGIFVGGLPPIAAGGLTPGTGGVTVDANLVQGNHAVTGDGGGIRLEFVNGAEAAAAPASFDAWYGATVENNIVVNNVAAHAGGGISLQDVVRGRVFNNTVANNDSTGTSSDAIGAGSANASAPQPAGIVAWMHSDGLRDAVAAATGVPAARREPWSNPDLANNIVWQNRSFSSAVDFVALTRKLIPDIGAGDSPSYWDLGVVDGPGLLEPRFCILTDAAFQPDA